jgi:predicted acetyltransferase
MRRFWSLALTLWRVSFELRTLKAEELVEWVEVMHIAFHSNWSAQEEAAHRLDVYLQNLDRSYAMFEQQPGTRGRVVGTYESFTTDLSLPGGNCVKANGISSISVLPTHHRRGLLTRMITHDLHAARERGEVASVLIAAEYPIYGRFGFGPATQRAAYELNLSRTQFTRNSSGSVTLKQPREIRGPARQIFERFRQQHPGQIGRLEGTWDGRLDLVPRPWRDDKSILRCALYSNPAGEEEGYLLYRVDWDNHASTLHVEDLITLTDDAYIGLWRFAGELDLLNEISAPMRRVDEPLPFLLTDPRKALRQVSREDFLWVRMMDVPAFLEARRYAADGKIVLQVHDPLDIAHGTFALEGGPDGATCQQTTTSPDITLTMRALGAMSLGGVAGSTLRINGEVEEHTRNSLTTLERMFQWARAPWCSTFF